MAAEEQDDEPQEPSWLHSLKSSGPVPLHQHQEQDEDDSSMGWCTPPGDCFQIRAKDYLTSKLKTSAGASLLQPLAMDWIKSASSARIDHVLKHPENRIMLGLKQARLDGSLPAGTEPFVWAINIQVPSKEHHSLIVYFVSTKPFQSGSLPDRFLNGDDEFRNSRLKLIANVVNGPWIVKTAVGEHAIVILGKQLTCSYHRGHNFLEVDVDIGSSMVASAIVHLAINYVTTLTVDLGFVIEARSEDELPEELLGSVRFAHLELGAAVPLGSSDGLVQQQEEEDDEFEEFEDALDGRIGGDSFSSRLWRQIGQGFSADWWQQQQQPSNSL